MTVPQTTAETGARERRCELLAAAERSEIVPLAEQVLESRGADRMQLVHPPEVGMVMLQVREPIAEERFYLGEVLVTRCTIELDGATGWSMRGGDDRIAALAGAVLDAAAECDPRTAAEVDEICARIDQRVTAEQSAEWNEIAPTKVAFEELT